MNGERMGKLTTEQLDRAVGALVGLAAGDALGAPYEFSVPGRGADIVMKPSGPWELGEWTDDTAQAVGIAEVTAGGSTDPVAIGQRFLDWFRGSPKDVGISTSAVLARSASAEALPAAAARYVAANPRGAAGNGTLMRTSPVALAHLGDDEAIARHAMEVSLLTHGDPFAGEACILWCVAIDRAVRERRLDGVWDGLDLLPDDRAAYWRRTLEEADGTDPHRFAERNGWVKVALQAAWATITSTPIPVDDPRRHLEDCLVEAVRIGNDTDTVAAITGQLVGAYWGYSAIPWRWRRHLHGWPGIREHDLARLAALTARRGEDDGAGWPSADSLVPWGVATEGAAEVCVELDAPVDEGGRLLVGNLPGLPRALEQGVDAVVSLCRVGTSEVPAGVEHARFWLVDQETPESNRNLAFALRDAADAVAALRREGRDVYLHCVGGRRRTAAVATAYLVRHHGMDVDAAWRQVAATLPEAARNPSFWDALSSGAVAEAPGPSRSTLPAR